jgi:tetratricopeptide (TPR) repeat protein
MAVDALSSASYATALNYADEAISWDGSSADGYLQRAIALSQMDRNGEAIAAFETACRLSPESAKIWYNRAVHEFRSGDESAAEESLNRALLADPNHQSAKELHARLTGVEVSSAPSEPPAEGLPVQQGYSTPPVVAGPSLPFVARLGKRWTFIGWMIALASLTAFGLTLAAIIPYSGLALVDPSEFQAVASKSPMMQWSNLIGTLSWMSAICYTVLDTINRRSNWAWVLPQILCSCVVGWIMMPLYLLLNRDSA